MSRLRTQAVGTEVGGKIVGRPPLTGGFVIYHTFFSCATYASTFVRWVWLSYLESYQQNDCHSERNNRGGDILGWNTPRPSVIAEIFSVFRVAIAFSKVYCFMFVDLKMCFSITDLQLEDSATIECGIARFAQRGSLAFAVCNSKCVVLLFRLLYLLLLLLILWLWLLIALLLLF